jgi:hypothetical protein
MPLAQAALWQAIATVVGSFAGAALWHEWRARHPRKARS